MGSLEEQFIDLYKSIPKALPPVDLLRNVRELMSRHGINSTQAMSMSYAVAVQNPEMGDDTKECLKRFLKPAEVEEAEKYQGLLKTLDEKAGLPSPAGFSASYAVYVSPWGDPVEYHPDYRQMTFLDGDREAFSTFKYRLKNTSANDAFKDIFNKKAPTEDELVNLLKQDMLDKGFTGDLVVTNTTNAKKSKYSLEPEAKPQLVPAESNIRRDAVDNGSEYIEALAELDALTGRAPLMAESQRPDISTVIGGMEEDLKKAVLVRLAEMFRGLGYEEWPTDEVGEKDMQNVMEAVSKGLKDMSGRMSDLIKGQIEAIKSGPEKYTENLSRWLAGQSAIVDEEEEEGDGEATDEAKKKKSKLAKDAQEFISAEISRLVKGGMDQQQAIAAAHSAAREKGMDVPEPSKKECGDVDPAAPEVSEPAPEENPEEVPEREPEVTFESKKARK